MPAVATRQGAANRPQPESPRSINKANMRIMRSEAHEQRGGLHCLLFHEQGALFSVLPAHHKAAPHPDRVRA
jgi:hypothetical protein